MGVGAAETKRTHGRAPGALLLRPALGRGGHRQLPIAPIQVGRGLAEMQMRRDLAVLHHQHTFEESSNAGGPLQVTEVGLERAQPQRLRAPRLAVNRREGLEFNWVTKRRAGAVRLEDIDVIAGELGLFEGPANQAGLGLAIGHRQTGTGSVLVDTTTPQHRQHGVPLG